MPIPHKEAVDEVLEGLPDSAWNPFEITQDYIRSFTMIDIGGVMTRAERTQFLADATLIEANRQDYNDSEGKRWGDGRIVARVPLNKWMDELRKSVKEGDRDHMKWWLNREENRPFRTFKGTI